MHDQDAATEAARQSVPGRADDIVSALAERVGARAGVGAIFGDPVEREGVTVIPVGRLRWAFGGGGGRGPGGEGQGDGEGEGAGGGGGVTASPAGYIEIRDGTASYRPVGFPVSPGTLIAGALAVYLTLRGLRLLWR
jgi:hypothetical protein